VLPAKRFSIEVVFHGRLIKVLVDLNR